MPPLVKLLLGLSALALLGVLSIHLGVIGPSARKIAAAQAEAARLTPPAPPNIGSAYDDAGLERRP